MTLHYTEEDDVLGFLNRFAYNLIFDDQGIPIDVIDIRGDQDMAARVDAIEAFYERMRPLHDAVLPSGFTLHQTMVLKARAPIDAHVMLVDDKPGKGGARRVTAYLPSRVQMRLFHLLFGDQFSFELAEHKMEERHALHTMQSNHGGAPTGSTPSGSASSGGVDTYHHAYAKVRLTLHLNNGSTRFFEGVGMAQDKAENSDTNPIADFYAARRSGKGVVSDAWRGAIERISPVFKSSFSEGSEMMDMVRGLILNRISGVATPTRTRTAKEPQNAETPSQDNNDDSHDGGLKASPGTEKSKAPTPGVSNPPKSMVKNKMADTPSGETVNESEEATPETIKPKSPKGSVGGGRAAKIGSKTISTEKVSRSTKRNQNKNGKKLSVKPVLDIVTEDEIPDFGHAPENIPAQKGVQKEGDDENQRLKKALAEAGIETQKDLDSLDTEIASDIKRDIEEVFGKGSVEKFIAENENVSDNEGLKDKNPETDGENTTDTESASVDPETQTWQEALEKYKALFVTHGIESTLAANTSLTRKLFKGNALKELGDACEEYRKKKV